MLPSSEVEVIYNEIKFEIKDITLTHKLNLYGSLKLRLYQH